MLIIKFIRIFLLFLIFYNFSASKADVKSKIIENINQTETIKFDFIQNVNDTEEKGICYLKRPFFLKCKYQDKNQKELIVNRNKFIIYNKRYNKIYNYPLSRSYFTEILNKELFKKIILDGSLTKTNNLFVLNYIFEKKGDITFYFDKENFDLRGWDLLSLNNSLINFKMLNDVKNLDIKEGFFDIPKIAN